MLVDAGEGQGSSNELGGIVAVNMGEADDHEVQSEGTLAIEIGF
jgi:hypothetical protein